MPLPKIKPLSIHDVRDETKPCFNCDMETKEYITWWKCPISADDVKICIRCFPKNYRVFKIEKGA